MKASDPWPTCHRGVSAIEFHFVTLSIQLTVVLLLVPGICLILILTFDGFQGGCFDGTVEDFAHNQKRKTHSKVFFQDIVEWELEFCVSLVQPPTAWDDRMVPWSNPNCHHRGSTPEIHVGSSIMASLWPRQALERRRQTMDPQNRSDLHWMILHCQCSSKELTCIYNLTSAANHWLTWPAIIVFEPLHVRLHVDPCLCGNSGLQQRFRNTQTAEFRPPRPHCTAWVSL